MYYRFNSYSQCITPAQYILQYKLKQFLFWIIRFSIDNYFNIDIGSQHVRVYGPHNILRWAAIIRSFRSIDPK